MNIEQLRQIKTFHSLVRFLRDELDWPIDSDDVEDITFEYDPAELGFDASEANLIKEIKQLRPLDSKQPWGIFWVDFEKKKLPVVVLRRVLGHLVVKKRASANRSSQPAWHLNDLLFLSAYGEDHDRAITLAHFWQNPENPTDLPVLKVLGWDGCDTVLHLADAYRTLSDHLRWPDDPSDLETWRTRWTSAFPLRHREVIETTQQLVSELARLATDIRTQTSTLLARESKTGPLRRLYSSFQATLIHDLAEEDFADVIAQTVTYGLLAAKFSHRAGISVSTLVDMVPRTNPFLRELLGTFLSLAGRKGAFDFDELGFHEVVDLLNHANTDAVKADFGNRTRNEDPVIHFYEHFLTAYDKKMKIKRGIFYTPQPVVSYIVRSVHELLQTEFGIGDGLASTITWREMQKLMPDLKIPDGVSPDEFFVNVLDPATGTATFLVEVIEVIFNHLINKWDKDGPAAMPAIPNQQSAFEGAQFKDYWNAYVPRALLPRLYGYELMMAPYTIAHMKFGLKLSEINTRLGQPDYEMEFEGRAHIYLTNSLEPPSDLGQQDLIGIFPALAHEAQAVNTVKRKKRFTVVIGNPPYSGVSANLSDKIRKIVEPYRFVNGILVKEKGALQFEKNLNDDYVKFFRLAEIFVEDSVGLLGIITNNGFLESITLRGMRAHLMKTFQKVSICDLHGDTDKRERFEDDSPDENVFDIKHGVAISLCSRIRQFSAMENGLVKRFDLKGGRDSKYRYLLTSDISRTLFQKCSPRPPRYLFKVENELMATKYDSWVSVSELLRVNSTGFESGRDEILTAFTTAELKDKLSFFCSAPEEEVRSRFSVNEGWGLKLFGIRTSINKDPYFDERFRSFLFGPFDYRRCLYKKDLLKTNSFSAGRHLCYGTNLALIIMRQVSLEGIFSHVGVSRVIVNNRAFYSTKGKISYFPLYLFSGVDDLIKNKGECLGSNVWPDRAGEIVKKLGVSWVELGTGDLHQTIGPEDLLNYVYAVTHSPTYRNLYSEFLKTDFPRVPITSSLELLRNLTRLGSELVSLHLMESPKLDSHITTFIGGKTPEVEKVSYSDETVWIDKAKTAGFKAVPEDIWNFQIGGYQVCHKWLKDRKGRTLTDDDINHYHRIVVVLSETIRLMAEIDKVIDAHGGWPNAFQALGENRK